ncbi:MAG: glycosyltransferase family 39 protein, partial [Planctomycetota bacterium]
MFMWKKGYHWIQAFPYQTLFLFALLLRLGSVFYFQHQSFSFFTDQDGYLEIADQMLAGNGMGENVHRTPLFPAYLAIHLALLPSREWALFAVKCSQAVLASLVPLLLVYLGKKLFSPMVGWIAGVFCAIEPFLIVVPSFVLTDSNYVFLLLIWVILFAEMLQSNRHAILLGVLTGIATLYRPSHLYLFPFMLICLGLFQRALCLQRKRSLLFALLAFLAVLAPWIYRNYQLTNHFIPGTIHLGWLLYVGNSEWADGSAVDSQIQEEETVKKLSPYERDRHYLKLALQWM